MFISGPNVGVMDIKNKKQKAYSIFWSTSIKVFLLQVN